jgi:hypothetical protein
VPVYHGLVETLLPDDSVTFGHDVIETYTNYVLEGLCLPPFRA